MDPAIPPQARGEDVAHYSAICPADGEGLPRMEHVAPGLVDRLAVWERRNTEQMVVTVFPGQSCPIFLSAVRCGANVPTDQML